MTEAIRIEKLTKSYGKERGVIDLDLVVEPGEVFGYLGPNGAGKTTTTAAGKTTRTDSNTTTDKAGWLVVADDNSTGTGFEFFDNSGLGDVLITPIGLASAVGVPLFGVLAVWWMWRRPSDDEEESSEFGD